MVTDVMSGHWRPPT